MIDLIIHVLQKLQRISENVRYKFKKNYKSVILIALVILVLSNAKLTCFEHSLLVMALYFSQNDRNVYKSRIRIQLGRSNGHLRYVRYRMTTSQLNIGYSSSYRILLVSIAFAGAGSES